MSKGRKDIASAMPDVASYAFNGVKRFVGKGDCLESLLNHEYTYE
jgi:hypothetical protein